MLSKAFQFATERHQGQKKNDAPYVYHPLSVGALVLRYGGNDEQAAAAFLHDTINEVSEQELAEKFSPEIARIAFGFSDPPLAAGSSWADAKKAYLEKLRRMDEKILLVVACEELHEGNEILHDLRYQGADVWKRFPVHSMEIFWYFKELLSIFHSRLRQKELVSEFAKMVNQLKGISLENRAF